MHHCRQHHHPSHLHPPHSYHLRHCLHGYHIHRWSSHPHDPPRHQRNVVWPGVMEMEPKQYYPEFLKVRTFQGHYFTKKG